MEDNPFCLLGEALTGLAFVGVEVSETGAEDVEALGGVMVLTTIRGSLGLTSRTLTPCD